MIQSFSYTQFVQQRPQGLAIHLTLVTEGKRRVNDSSSREAYVGWTGMASASSLAQFNSGGIADKVLETIEIDPQFAEGLGFSEGDVVRVAVGWTTPCTHLSLG